MNVNQKKILAHTQFVARRFIAWRGHLPDLVKYVVHSAKHSVKPDEVELVLRKAETQKELHQHWEVALWRANDQTWRLVSLAVNPDPAIAHKRLNEFPASTNQCRYCWIDERSQADYELIPEMDLRRTPVPASRLHPQCKRAWMQLRALAELEEAQ